MPVKFVKSPPYNLDAGAVCNDVTAAFTHHIHVFHFTPPDKIDNGTHRKYLRFEPALKILVRIALSSSEGLGAFSQMHRLAKASAACICKHCR